MSVDVREFRRAAAGLQSLARASIAVPMAELLANVWIDESRRVMGHDTWQLDARTGISSVSGSGSTATVELVADTPYAGYHNNLTRFWQAGEAAALARAWVDLGGPIETMTAQAFTSGGVSNPRSLFR